MAVIYNAWVCIWNPASRSTIYHHMCLIASVWHSGHWRGKEWPLTVCVCMSRTAGADITELKSCQAAGFSWSTRTVWSNSVSVSSRHSKTTLNQGFQIDINNLRPAQLWRTVNLSLYIWTSIQSGLNEGSYISYFTGQSNNSLKLYDIKDTTVCIFNLIIYLY